MFDQRWFAKGTMSNCAKAIDQKEIAKWVSKISPKRIGIKMEMILGNKIYSRIDSKTKF